MASVLAALLPRPISLTPATEYRGSAAPLGVRWAEALTAPPGTTPSHLLMASVRALLLPRPTALTEPTAYGTPFTV